MREEFGYGETVELAKENALKALGVETAEFEVLEEPQKKILGLFGGKPAKVRAFVEDSPAQAAIAYLLSVAKGMGAEKIEVSAEENEEGAVLNVTGEDSGVIIGHHGETLDALQYLVGMVANHACEKYYRITVNVGDYREKRDSTLAALANRMAKKALANGRRYSLEPMNPYERRIIHTAVQEVPGAISWSEGADMDRHVVIGPEGSDKRPERKENRNRGGKDNRRGGNGHGRGNNRGGQRRSAKPEKLSDLNEGLTQITDVKKITKEISEIPAVETMPEPIAPKESTKPTKSSESEKIPLYGRIN